ncbi:phenylalanine--tRNA ligase subunit alpha [Terriglobus aquaticus]|uniref:Phenylalanine--tRNA ligase alpha subunit n=1 Tax=Terriglobus aquaticus TaxID=940139 RepID=A0ABW9KGA3_9BACT|nr:phenylalanine--tRNA ligase subunit alpha [Terriglobus aquaticus]
MIDGSTAETTGSGDSLDLEFSKLTEEVRAAAGALTTPEAKEQFRLDWLGRKSGRLKTLSDAWLKSAPPDQKKSIGMRFNQLKAEIEAALDAEVAPARTSASSLDLSLPGIRRAIGVEHPLTRTMREMTAVFAALGYSVGIGPEVETDFYNFEALNFPPNHPARDTQDTLVVADQESKPLRERYLMRTHTSPVQIRSMVANNPPLRLVIPGKVHRNDESDATHSPIFHQVEGLCVDRGITFSDLKGTLDYAMKAFFGSSVKTRFFPSFFPFTEPSADVQISCPFCGQKGCRKCKFSGWIELLGCGMVDPAVFAAVDARRVENGLEPAYDVPGISGFAFGMGVERIAMMKYGVGDIGQFYSGDVRFLSQFV